MTIRLVMFVFVMCGLAGCTQLRGAPSAEVRLVAVGDSILAWNRRSGEDIPTLVSQQTGLPVFNNAISGAEFVGRFAIPAQYREGNWDWLIMDGGGNDLSGTCASAAEAEPILDRLIDDETLQGAYGSFLAPITERGTQVIIMGYMPTSTQGGPFAACADAFDDLRERQIRLAATNPAIIFVDTREVIAPDNLAAYDTDLVHPTPLGGRLIARQIAAVINADR